ncbi:hypothetical protein FNV43_RR12858 [Rhamnella rubrinervis]|uniref:Uncharacterized protein n=1 Tax=Rhamnella rubrinervis TaxID=2594499 RepID=A0A8K0GZY6_9ROSA|nr:hypothetical protein FNV43_RR12858 [Rhamnella rubrinervis]
MAPLKRLRKASDKSTEATTVTEAAATKKRSREVEESSNAPAANLDTLANFRRRPNWQGCLLYMDTLAKVQGLANWRGALLLYRDTLAKCGHRQNWRGALLIYGHPRPNLRHRQKFAVTYITRHPTGRCLGKFGRGYPRYNFGGFVHHSLSRQLYNDDLHVIEVQFNGVGARFDRRPSPCFRLNRDAGALRDTHGSHHDIASSLSASDIQGC